MSNLFVEPLYILSIVFVKSLRSASRRWQLPPVSSYIAHLQRIAHRSLFALQEGYQGQDYHLLSKRIIHHLYLFVSAFMMVFETLDEDLSYQQEFGQQYLQ